MLNFFHFFIPVSMGIQAPSVHMNVLRSAKGKEESVVFGEMDPWFAARDDRRSMIKVGLKWLPVPCFN